MRNLALLSAIGPTTQQPSITLAILAGGEGSRMGQAKGLIQLGGIPILQFLLERLAWPGPTLLVTAPGRERPPAADQFDAEVVDPVAGQGPLRGVLTALEAATTPWVAVTTVDMPGVRRDALKWMAGRMGDAVGIMCSREATGQPQIEPFPAIFRVSAALVIRERLDQRRRSVHGLSTAPGFRVVPSPAEWDPSVWENLNTPGDVARHRGGGVAG